MKFFIMLFLLPLTSMGQVILQQDNLTDTKDLIEVKESNTSMPAKEKLWAYYKTDDCLIYDKNNLNEDNIREFGFRRCRDNTISYVQPDSVGAGGWEGKCGQTFAANSLYSICSLAVDPKVYFKKYLRDLTPGVLPRTLKKGMGKAFKENANYCPSEPHSWSNHYASDDKSFSKTMKQLLIPKYSHPNIVRINRGGKSYLRNPVGALIQNPGGKYLHWVTVVDVLTDVNICKFIVNHWDNQYEVPCKQFAKWSGSVGKTYPVVLKSYSTVVFK